ncbi:hypothetical protein [Vibrio cholerae]|uniref:hypothetical protein n=1 Tax=Vibrio cholerae TaxID=666 RepID=UPI001C3118C1
MKRIKYNRDNHPKVRHQSKEFKETIYPVYALTEINIQYNGGIKFHRQHNQEIIHLQNLSGSDKHYGARLFLYMVNLAHKRGNKGFKVSLDNHLFISKGKDDVSFQSWMDTLEAAVMYNYGKLYIGCSTQDNPAEIELEGRRYCSVFQLYDAAFDLIKNKDASKCPNTSIPSVSAKHLLELTIKHENGFKKWETPYPTMKGSKPYTDALNLINRHNMKFVFRNKHGVIFDPQHRRKFSLYANERKNEKRGIYESYGRFINDVQNMTETDRGLITIGNGAEVWEVEEWDYSSNHARIAYELEGIRLDEDFKPYHIAEKDTPLIGSAAAKRSVYKSAIMMLFNSGNPTISLFNDLEDTFNKIESKGVSELNYRKRVLSELKRPTLEDCSKVVRLIKKANSAISDWFTGNKAAKLQNLDSRIAERIMLILVEKNVPFLCIHDSFVVPKQHGKILEQAMFDGWEHVLGSRDCCVVDCKTKPLKQSLKPVEIPEDEPQGVEIPELDQLLLECDLKPFTRAGQLIDSLSNYNPDEVRMRRLKLSREVEQQYIKQPERNEFLEDVYGCNIFDNDREDWRTII